MPAIALCLLPHILHAQFSFHLDSINCPPKGEQTVTFGDLMNIKVSYRVRTPNTTDQALTELKKYCLIINGIVDPKKNIGSMQIVKYCKDSTRSDTTKTRDTVKKADVTSIDTTTFNSIIFQTVIDKSHTDTGNKNELSQFWRQNYKPLSSQGSLMISLLGPGPASQSIERSAVINLRFYEMWRVWIFVVIFLLLLTGTLWKASKDNFTLLRDDVGGCKIPGKANPFSLSRVQVLVWTFVIFGLAAYLWGVTDFFPALSGGHLVLLGIAAGQKIISQIIDTPGGAVKQPGLTMSNDTENPQCSAGFFTDIISDQTGLSITRLQYAIVSIIYLVMFITTGIQKLELMTFSIEQLALMGTSAGLYLWDKQLTKKAAGAPPNAANPPLPNPPANPNPGQGNE